jgi:hypothetical protein
MRILTPKSEAEETHLCTCYLYYPKASKQNNLNFSDRRFFPFVHLIWEYFREFLRKFEPSFWDTQGLWGNLFMKKT